MNGKSPDGTSLLNEQVKSPNAKTKRRVSMDSFAAGGIEGDDANFAPKSRMQEWEEVGK